MNQIAIAILNYNGKNLIQRFFPSLLMHSPQATIYLIDNASTDNSVAYVQHHFPQVKIIQNPKNYGFAQGYNAAIPHINEEILCLLNSDVEVTPHWLPPVLDLFAQNPQVGIVQPKVLDYHNPTHFEYAGAAGGFIDQYAYPYCRGRVFNTIEQDHNQYDTNTPIFWASGACMFIKKDLFQSLGGFDPHYFSHFEEIDLCWRAYNHQTQVYYCAQSKVYHIGGATLNKYNPKKTYLNYRNSLLTLYKNLPAQKLIPTIFIRLCLDGISGIRLLLQLKPLHCWAIVRAHFAFYALLPKMTRTKTPKPNYYQTKSIVYQYFVKQNKHYSQLK